jgi:prepilin-type processing-associated H-X9-DG protein
VLYTTSKTQFRDVLDGTANTLMIGERGIPDPPVYGWLICGGAECEQYLSTEYGLSEPRDALIERLGSYHKGGSQFVYADGSVQFIKDGILPRILRELSTRAGGDIANAY